MGGRGSRFPEPEWRVDESSIVPADIDTTKMNAEYREWLMVDHNILPPGVEPTPGALAWYTARLAEDGPVFPNTDFIDRWLCVEHGGYETAKLAAKSDLTHDQLRWWCARVGVPARLKLRLARHFDPEDAHLLVSAVRVFDEDCMFGWKDLVEAGGIDRNFAGAFGDEFVRRYLCSAARTRIEFKIKSDTGRFADERVSERVVATIATAFRENTFFTEHLSVMRHGAKNAKDAKKKADKLSPEQLWYWYNTMPYVTFLTAIRKKDASPWSDIDLYEWAEQGMTLERLLVCFADGLVPPWTATLFETETPKRLWRKVCDWWPGEAIRLLCDTAPPDANDFEIVRYVLTSSTTNDRVCRIMQIAVDNCRSNPRESMFIVQVCLSHKRRGTLLKILNSWTSPSTPSDPTKP